MRPAGSAALALLLLPLGCRESPPPPVPAAKNEAPAHVKEIEFVRPPHVPIMGGSPEPPPRLPAARACRDAPPSYHQVDPRAGQVNGKLIDGADGLRRLRRAWGDALVVVRGGDFSGADLRGTRLHNICFLETNFERTDLRGIDSPGIGFVGVNLKGARLDGARLREVLFSRSDLEDVEASGADLSDGSLSGSALAEWKNLRLDRADLRRFRFQCGKGQEDQCAPYWRKVSFRHADLRGAAIDTFWGDADWTGARLGGTEVNLRQIAHMADARIEGPLVIRESAARVRLSRREAEWLRRHVQPAAPDRSFFAPDRRLPSPRARAGTVALFVASPVYLDAEARRSPLYRRLMPAIVSAAYSYVEVRAHRDGRVTARGEALGANHHMCTLQGPPLRLDRRTGWYSGPAQGPLSSADEKWAGPVRPVLRLWNGKAEVHGSGHPDEFNDYFTCGARAFFYEMSRVPFPAAEARRLWSAKG